MTPPKFGVARIKNEHKQETQIRKTLFSASLFIYDLLPFPFFFVSLSQPKASYIYVEVRWKLCSMPNLQQAPCFLYKLQSHII